VSPDREGSHGPSIVAHVISILYQWAPPSLNRYVRKT
jgi:hypothetical protein